MARRTDEQCPPHWFEAAWTDQDEDTVTHGVIYCRWCGEVRPLEVQRIEAPVEERIERR